MALLDLLGRRWNLRILWELREGRFGFRALQEDCDGMSPSVLSERLMELQEAGMMLHTTERDYPLTQEGQELLQMLTPLHNWAERWARRDEQGHVTSAQAWLKETESE